MKKEKSDKEKESKQSVKKNKEKIKKQKIKYDNKTMFIIILFIITIILIINTIINTLSANIKTDNYFENAQVRLDCVNADKQYISTTLQKGEEITCSMDFSTYLAEGYKDYIFKNINFELKVGSGFEIIKTKNLCNSDYCSLTENNNKYSLKLRNADMMTEEEFFEIKLKVKENVEVDNLFISLDNISFKNKKDKIYQVDDLVEKYYVFTGNYYFYENDYEYEIKSYKDVILTDSLKSTYECKTKNCTFIYKYSKYAIMQDENFIIINMENGKKIEIPKENIEGYSKYEIVYTDEKVHGLLLSDESKTGYYSIEKEKMVIPAKEYQSIDTYAYSNRIIVIYKNNKIELYDLKGNRFKPNSDHKIENSNYYYSIHVYIDENNNGNLFLNSEGEKLFDGKLIKNYKYLNNEQLMILNEKEDKWVIYEKNQKIKESNPYKKVLSLMDNYIIVLDNSNNINIIDYQETLITTLDTLDKVENYMYSYYDETVGKIVVQTTSDKLIKDNKGYIYTFNISTNEITKKDTNIELGP